MAQDRQLSPGKKWTPRERDMMLILGVLSSPDELLFLELGVYSLIKAPGYHGLGCDVSREWPDPRVGKIQQAHGTKA